MISDGYLLRNFELAAVDNFERTPIAPHEGRYIAAIQQTPRSEK